MDGLLQDLRYALRQMLKSPGFTVVAVVTLALGIGANTAIFSVVNAVLLRPLPYPNAGQLVMLWEQNPHRGWFENIISGENFLDWQKQNHVFAGMAAFESDSFNVTGNHQAEEIAGERVGLDLFSVLGVQPFRGRLFLPEEDRHDKAAVILSYGLWQRRYGGDPDIVGKQISLNGESYPVVGILPPTFSDDYSSFLDPHSQLWLSGIEPFEPGRESHAYHAIARLKPGVSLAQAQANMSSIAAQIEQQYSESQGWGVAVIGLHDQVVKYARPTLIVLLVAVGLVLLIACANVANLLLVRATGRQKETAIRTALGASRSRLARQLFVESVLLSITGAVAGLALAPLASRILVLLTPPDAPHVPHVEGVAINGLVMMFTAGLALGTGVVFGLAPMFSSARVNVNESLKGTTRATSGGARDRRLRDLLVIGEFGLSLVLLAGAGLMIKALTHLHHVDLGFNPDHLLTVTVPLDGPQYQRTEKQAGFFHDLVARIGALPGVESASLSRGVPVRDWDGQYFITADNPHPAAGEVPDTNYVCVGPHYFKTMRIPIVRGRVFSDFDTQSSEPAAIVSQSLATKYWPGQDPIGKRLKISGDADDNTQPWRTVVGVAENVRSDGQYWPFRPEIYVPYTQFPWILSPRNIVVRTTVEPLSIVPEIRRQVAALDKDVPVSDIATMEEITAGPVQQGKAVMWLLGSLATLALVLSAVGIYSVISYSVSQRTREIGIRMALGASDGSVASMVVRQGLLLALIGLGAGLLGASAMGRIFSGLPFKVRLLLLFDVRPTDPVILASVSLLLTTVAVLACFLPARRAAKVDPMVALRYE
ncbi:MAG: ABC transporter permease [Candidatus Sulfotelmatobacter sp.]